jgi:cytidylate kinase
MPAESAAPGVPRNYPANRERAKAQMVIAIDGPAGAGKSSVARRVADALDFTYLDSGAMYRSVALAAMQRGTDLDDPEAMGDLAESLEIGVADGQVQLDGSDVTEAIRSAEVTAAASRAAVHPRVRAAMVGRQRAMIDAGRYVAEGRDIGTVVSPDAPLKVFLTAGDEERAQRRAEQTGEPVSEVLDSQRRRDSRDTTRKHSGLHPAPDAVELDTTSMSLDEVVSWVVKQARQRGIS